jgi:hypothetical protein
VERQHRDTIFIPLKPMTISHPRRSPRIARFALWLVCSQLAFIGCGYPAAQPANQELIASLRTALSARNEVWLAQNEEKIESRRSAGRMNDDEYEAFKAIVAQARAGDWTGAERASLDFQRAQRPTDVQIEQARPQPK